MWQEVTSFMHFLDPLPLHSGSPCACMVAPWTSAANNIMSCLKVSSCIFHSLKLKTSNYSDACTTSLTYIHLVKIQRKTFRNLRPFQEKTRGNWTNHLSLTSISDQLDTYKCYFPRLFLVTWLKKAFWVSQGMYNFQSISDMNCICHH